MKLHFSALSLAAAIGVLAAGTALATPVELQIQSVNSSNTVVQSTGILGLNTTCSGTLLCNSSQIEYNNSSFDGWDIVVTGGISNSPSITPYALDINSLTATCSSGGCLKDNLVISLSDNDFTALVPMNGFGVKLSGSSTGTFTESAYGGNSNSYFDESNQIGKTITIKNDGSVTESGGGPAGPDQYSLTLVDTLMHGSGTSFSTDGRIVPTPEPGTLALFGAGLLGCAIFVGRRRRSSQNRA